MSNRMRSMVLAGVLTAAGLSLGAAPVRAQGFAFGYTSPGLSIGVGRGFGYYGGAYGAYPYAGAYPYVAPAPVVVAPAPVVVAPAPVVVPAPVYLPRGYYGYGYRHHHYPYRPY